MIGIKSAQFIELVKLDTIIKSYICYVFIILYGLMA